MNALPLMSASMVVLIGGEVPGPGAYGVNLNLLSTSNNPGVGLAMSSSRFLELIKGEPPCRSTQGI